MPKIKMNKKSFRERFEKKLYNLGEVLFPGTSTEQITNVFEAQGYWAGVSFRIYYDEEQDKFTHERRKFGLS